MTKRYYKYREIHRTVFGRKQKYCSKCKKWKGESEFGTDRAKRDGLKMACRECDRAYARALLRKLRNGKKARIYLRFEERHKIVRGVRQKLCCRCKQWKDESLYYKNCVLKDGLSLSCTDCDKKNARKRFEHKGKGVRRYLRYEQRHRVVNGIKQKLCTKCRRWKKESAYYKNSSEKDDLSACCMNCTYKVANKSYEPKRKRVRRNLRYEDRHRVVKGVRQKFCRMCKRWKSEDEFYKNRLRKGGLDNRCKTCSYKPVERSPKRMPL